MFERWFDLVCPAGAVIIVVGFVRILFGPNLHTPVSAAQIVAEEVRKCVEIIDKTQQSWPEEWRQYAKGAKQDCGTGW
jgi:hypothetical protein